MAVEVHLLGEVQVLDGQEQHLPPLNKPLSLLAYLACQGSWVERERLAFLFWPDTGNERARTNLRGLITRCKKLPFTAELETEASRVRWNVTCDVRTFKQALEKNAWSEAVALYGGDLLASASLDETGEFSSWLVAEREALREGYRTSVFHYSQALQGCGQDNEAIKLLEELRSQDPLDEEALQRYLQLLGASKQWERARRAYEEFRHGLFEELGLEPSASTLSLLEAIKAEDAEALEAISGYGLSARASLPISGQAKALPIPSSPFVGRDLELVEVAQRLEKPACQLLTLVGPGGMGKTRLALEVAATQGDAFADGVAFISFAPVGSVDLMATTIAGTLGLSFFGSDDPKRQLLGYLRNKKMLLVLDNLEHLLKGAQFIAEILEAAPKLKLLVTSREPLQLRAEWVFDLEGLSYPQSLPSGDMASVGSWEDYDAVRLFVQSAVKARADFIPGEQAAPAILRVCQLVKGMPLALELAAGWLRVLTLEEVAEEIEKGLDLLETSIKDMPSRHQSLRAVFDHSWTLLPEEEKSALRKLSVFRGGFTREAAAKVADVSLPLLLSLRNKSFLKATTAKRFERHPLVWQYSLAKARAHPEERLAARERHCAYYASFLHEREPWIYSGSQQQEALQSIERDIDNVRTAWRWAIKQRDLEALGLLLESLKDFNDVRGFFQEGESTFRTAAEAFSEDSVTLGRLLVAQALFTCRQHDLDAAQAVCERGLAMLERLKAPQRARAFIMLSIIRYLKNDWQEARTLSHKALRLARANGDAYGTANALNQLALIAEAQEDVEEAKRFFQESILVSKQQQDRLVLSAALNNLGSLHLELGELEAARSCLQEALRYAEEMSNENKTAVASMNLGILAHREGKYKQAQRAYLASLAIWKRLQEPRMVRVLVGLGETAQAQQDYHSALTHFSEALAAALEFWPRANPARPAVIRATVGAADTLMKLGEEEKALVLLTFGLKQKTGEHDVIKRAEQLHAQLLSSLPAVVTTAQNQIHSPNIHSPDIHSLEDIQKMLLVLAQQFKRAGSNDVP